MNIILLEKVANLGNLGDRVTVRSGYARNFLLPKGKATLATPANIARFEARRAEPTGDIASLLANAEIDGAPVPFYQMYQVAGLLQFIVVSFAVDPRRIPGTLLHYTPFQVSILAVIVMSIAIQLHGREISILEGVAYTLLLLTVIGVILYYMVEGVERIFVPSSLSKDGDPTQASM